MKCFYCAKEIESCGENIEDCKGFGLIHKNNRSANNHLCYNGKYILPEIEAKHGNTN